ncbi:MAG: efflux RND transporter periplasmic adaptor subunit [Erythrobacter sp.]|nr:efflux RND transporter periplasmic adaptor subunit [Erythrobacter sp.]
MRTTTAFYLIYMAVSLVLPSAAFAQGGPPPANVTLDEVLSETLTQRRAVTGEIRSRLTSELASQVEGLLIGLDVEEGDYVTQGQVVAKLDDERAKITVARELADVEFARAVIVQRTEELQNAKRELERIEQLDELGSAGVSQLDNARTLVASRNALLAQAKAELATAEGDLALAERELNDMSIEAPFAGRVVRKSTEVGEWIGRGDEIVTIVSLDTLEARIDIPEDIYPAVSKAREANSKIELRLPALGLSTGEEIYGEVITILPAADSLSRLFPVRIAVDNSSNTIRPGMSLSALVPTGTEGDYITVHKDAIVRTPTGEVVYFANDGVSAIAPIERLFVTGERVAVRSFALQPGMSVVVSGNERMFPGQPLNILDEPKGADLSQGAKRAAPGSAKNNTEGSN